MRRIVAMGALALLSACAGRTESSGMVAVTPDSYSIEARSAWPSRQVRPTLDAAVAHCAEAGKQTAVQSTRIDPDRYTVVFSCGEPLSAPRRLVLDGARGRPQGLPVTQAVLVPAEAPAPTLVISAQPYAFPIDDRPAAIRVVPRRATPPVLSADNPFASGALPTAAPAASRLPGAAFGFAPVGRQVAPPLAAELPRTPAALVPVASGLPGAPTGLPAAPPSSFWMAPR